MNTIKFLLYVVIFLLPFSTLSNNLLPLECNRTMEIIGMAASSTTIIAGVAYASVAQSLHHYICGSDPEVGDAGGSVTSRPGLYKYLCMVVSNKYAHISLGVTVAIIGVAGLTVAIYCLVH